MANIIATTISKVASWFGGDPAQIQKRGPGERKIMSLLPTAIGNRSNFSWTSNRIEQVNHFRGWSYVSVHAICCEIAGIFPQMAIRRDGEEMSSKRVNVQFAKGLTAKRAALLDLDRTRRKYLSRNQRTKVLAHAQDHEELEPVGPGHPLLKLLGKPNPVDTWWTFGYKMPLYLQTTGSTYIWKVRDGYGDIRELWVLPAHWVWAVPGKDSFAEFYEIRPVAGYTVAEQGIGWFMGGSGYTRIPAEDIIAVQYPNPVNIFDGQSPLMASANWTQCSESIDESRTAAFINEMLPGVILLLDKEVLDPPEGERERLKARIIAEYAGVRKSRQPIILSPGVTLAPDQRNTPVEMDHFNSSDQLKTYIMAAQKVGPSQVGMTEEVTFAGAIAAKANFHQCTIRPILLLIGEALTRGLVEPHYDENGLLYWKDATPEDPEFVLKKWETATRMGWCTLNEPRQHVLGLEPYEHGGDDPILPMGSAPMPIGTGDEYDDVVLGALDAKAGEQADEAAEQAAQQQEQMAGQPDANGEPVDDTGEQRAALGEGEQESDGEKISGALQRARAGKRLAATRFHRNGVLNGAAH